MSVKCRSIDGRMVVDRKTPNQKVKLKAKYGSGLKGMDARQICKI